MIKFHVVIDTSIYRKNPSRTDLAFLALDRLCRNGIVQLHLPYIVEREFQTQQSAQYKQELDTALKGLNAVIRKGPSPLLTIRTEKIREELNATIPEILADAEASISAWADSIGAKKHPITKNHATAAMESYFQGKPPLKSPKVREDIPDSFIFQTIKELSTSSKQLVVIAEDGKIVEASESLPGVSVFKSLSSFIESRDVQAEISALEVTANPILLRATIAQHENDSNTIADFVMSNAASKLPGERIYSDSIPDDNHEALITSFYEPDSVQLSFDELSYYGQGEFGLPFQFITSVLITYYIFKGDYYLIDEDKMPHVSDHNDHYYEAEEEVKVFVMGMAKLAIPPSKLKEITIENLEENLKCTINSIDEIEVQR